MNNFEKIISTLACLGFFLTSLISCSAFKQVQKSSDLALTAERKTKSNFDLLWIKNNDPDYEAGNLPIATNSPLSYKDILYVGHNGGQMMAYDLENGRVVWAREEGGDFPSRPIIYKDSVIYGNSNGSLFARHYLTGELKYRVDLESAFESEGSVYKGMLFFQLRNHKIVAMDATTGKILWAYKRSVPYLTTIQMASRPTVIDNKLFAGFADGSVCAFSIEDGVLLWEKKIVSGSKFIDVDMTPTFFAGKLIIGSISGQVTVLSPETGNTERKLEIVANRSPLVQNDNLIFGTMDGSIVVVDGLFNTVKEKKITDLPIGKIKKWKNGLLVPSVGSRIWLVDINTLGPLEAFDLGHASSSILGEVDVADDKLSLLSSRNRLYVFK